LKPTPNNLIEFFLKPHNSRTNINAWARNIYMAWHTSSNTSTWVPSNLMCKPPGGGQFVVFFTYDLHFSSTQFHLECSRFCIIFFT
jgi:hypothetical protein